MKYLTNSGLSYFLNKIKAYLTSSTYLNSIGISNSDIDDIADDAGYSSGSLPQSEDIFITGDIIPNTDNSVDLGASSKNIKMIYTKGITINGTQFLPSDYVDLTNNQIVGGIKTFSNAPVVNSIYLDGKTIDTDANSNMTYDGHIIDTIEEQGAGYIRYSSGLQICWGQASISIQKTPSNLCVGVSAYYGAKSVSFGAAFKNNASTYCITTPIDEAPGLYGSSTMGLNNTGAVLELYGGNYDVDVVVQYIAIGRWK